MSSYLLDLDSFDYPSWGEKFPDAKVTLTDLAVGDGYREFFAEPEVQKELKKVEEFLSYVLSVKIDVDLFPYPDLVFNALNTTPLERVRVVIIGQDPYHNCHERGGKKVPQAIGLSFAVPVGVQTPPSLKNIYDSQKKSAEITFAPSHGNLQSWAAQGCLMLNSSLTVQRGHPNSHQKKWSKLTDRLIEYISERCDRVIFLLWGAHAIDKSVLIDSSKHTLLKSSHPSPYSYLNRCRGNPSFSEADHFKRVNELFDEWGEDRILWQVS